MAARFSKERLRFALNRFRERLWVKPTAVCLLSIAAAFCAKLVDGTGLAEFVPEIEAESIESLLSIMAASMLVIATFSVASMVAAYASASTTATPRSFGLVIADDASQYALSTFVGAFIFSVVALTAVKNDYFQKAGLFILFLLTVIAFAIVIMTFVKWVDRIARLGRLGWTIDKLEAVTAEALKRRRDAKTLGGVPVTTRERQEPIYASRVGYVQHIDIASLQAWAEKAQVHVIIAALPGKFATPDRALAYLTAPPTDQNNRDYKEVVDAFTIGGDRLYEDDPRFGFVVLSEIAGRALSPAVNDPGTAIDIIGTHVRLFALWNEPPANDSDPEPKYDRVEVPEVSMRDMFDDAFTAIARDGAGAVEVMVRLQKGLRSLTSLGNDEMRVAAVHHARLALKRSKLAMDLPEDLAVVEEAAKFAQTE